MPLPSGCAWWPRTRPLEHAAKAFPGLVLAVKSGAGLAPLPTVLADGESELVRVIDSVPELVTHYYLLMHPDMQHTPRVRAFYDFVESEIKLFRGALVRQFPEQQIRNDSLHSRDLPVA